MSDDRLPTPLPGPGLAPAPLAASATCVDVTQVAASGGSDDTERFRTALQQPCATVPPGQYAISGSSLTVTGTLTLLPGAQLRIDGAPLLVRGCVVVQHGALVVRSSTSPSTDPVVILCADEAALTGGGTVQSGKASAPRGVVCIGPPVLGQVQNVLWARVDDITIKGIDGGDADAVGLNLDSSPDPNLSTTYCAIVTNVRIRYAAVGVKVGKLCNGHTFANLMFSNIRKCSYWSFDNSENTFLGGFTQYSHGATVIKLERAGWNLFYAVQGEPGQDRDAQGNPTGPPSHYFDVDADSLYCQILGHDMCLAPPIYTPPTSSDPKVIHRALTYLSSGVLSLVNLETIAHDRTWFGAPYQPVPMPSGFRADSTAATLDQLRTDFNALLHGLRASGVMASS